MKRRRQNLSKSCRNQEFGSKFVPISMFSLLENFLGGNTTTAASTTRASESGRMAADCDGSIDERFAASFSLRACEDDRTIKLNVMEARDLYDRRTFFTQSPFVEVRMGKDMFVTTTAKKGGTHPRWHDRHRFKYSNQRFMDFEVQERTSTSDGKPIGVGQIDLVDAFYHLPVNGILNVDIKLYRSEFHRKKGKQDGVLCVTLEFCGFHHSRYLQGNADIRSVPSAETSPEPTPQEHRQVGEEKFKNQHNV